jgi:methylmalonyl-CoA mutase
MEQKDKNIKLFSEFPPVKTKEWEEKIAGDLKGRNYARELIWNTGEGFTVKPYYRDEDLEKLSLGDMVPGKFPYIRGYKINNNDWYIRQDILVDDIKDANKKALDVLMKGVNSLGFIFNPKFEPTIDEIEQLCENIFADAVELNFVCYHNSLKVVQIVEKLVKKYNRNLERIYGSVDFDPLGQFALKGTFPVSSVASFDLAKQLVDAAQHLPYLKVITVNGTYFHNSGSSIVEELSFALAQGTNYLTQLTERGLTVDKISPRIKFQMAVGSKYFLEIAKFRAARLLWANIVKAYGCSCEDACIMNIHAITSDWNKTVYDPYVNILRTTTESMSAIIAGTDSLTVNPFYSTFQETTEFSERLARNQQLILKEESYLDKVVDPAAGAYYIESLTDSIANQAWKLFLQVQEKGSFLEALKSGFIQETIEKTAQQRDMAIATRNEILLGTNQYANPGEVLMKEVTEKVFAPTDRSADTAIIPTLKPYRGAQAFELMRFKTDRFAENGKRPKVFMLTLGNPAMRRARAQFAGNFFACAGFKIDDHSGYKSVEVAVAACLKAKADIAVICSSDDEYAELAPMIFEQLKDKAIVVVAGYPKAIIDTLKQKGIQHFIHVKSNVLETLKEFQLKLNIN